MNAIAPKADYTAISMFTFVLFCGSLLFGISRYLWEAYAISAYQVMFFYCAFGLIGMAPIIARQGGLKALKTSRFKLHATRGVLEYISFSITIYALGLMQMPVHTALSFVTPIIGSITAIVILKESPTHHTFVALVLGIVGVLVITQPWTATVNPHAFIMLIAGLGFALCGVSIKLLTSTENSTQIAFYMLFLTGIISIPMAIIHWQPIGLIQMPWLVGIGVCALAQQVLVAKAIQRVPLTVVIPLNFLMLLFTSAIAYLFFSEVITPATLAGAAIIIIATLYSTYGSSRQRGSVRDEPIV